MLHEIYNKYKLYEIYLIAFFLVFFLICLGFILILKMKTWNYNF